MKNSRKQNNKSNSKKTIHRKPSVEKRPWMSCSWTTVSMCCLGLSIVWLRYLNVTHERSNVDKAPELVMQSHIRRLPKISHRRWNVTCSNHYRPFMAGCHPRHEHCARVMYDDFLTAAEVSHLRSIADVGMAGRSKLGGPTIMDMNSGYVKDGQGLMNIYHSSKSRPVFTAQDYELYKSVVESIRQKIMDEFHLETLYFTAPTFITRLVGNASWSPQDLHDEYWHPHVDKDNTPHYDYSGLVYLSNYDQDFTGGLFTFIEAKTAEFNVIEPSEGRLLIFNAGRENLHQAQRVESGTRYVLSLWFTCDPTREFEHFLDGQMHQHFRHE